MSDNIISFTPGGGGRPPSNYTSEQVAEILFQIDKATETINHLTAVIASLKEDNKRLIDLITLYDEQLSVLITDHVEHAKKAGNAAKKLDEIRAKISRK